MIVPVILSGGSGSRLWPLSRSRRPKQLIAMVDSHTMLGATVLRAAGLADAADPLVVCNVDHHHLVAQELADLGHDPSRIVLEPIGRNTAPAVAAAALVVTASDGADALMLVLPADHVITDERAFQDAVAVGMPHAADGALVTFGIVPDRPETGYGYIRSGETVDGSVNRISEFVEKPDEPTASRYVADGRYLWNSGMFLFSAGAYLDELATHHGEMLSAVEQAVERGERDGAIVLDRAAFSSAPSDSIDYAVMEHTKAGVVVPLDAGWSDVGSWAALRDVSTQDAAGNTLLGDVVALDTTDSYVRAEQRLVATIGIDKMVVVETGDSVVVAPLDRSQDVKRIVDDLKTRQRSEAIEPQTTRRPWGVSRSIATGPGYSLTLMSMSPGARAELPGPLRVVVLAGKITHADGDARQDHGPGDVFTTSPGTVTVVHNSQETAAELIAIEIGVDA